MGVESLSQTRSDNLINASVLEDSQLQEFLAQSTVAQQMQVVPMYTSLALRLGRLVGKRTSARNVVSDESGRLTFCILSTIE